VSTGCVPNYFWTKRYVGLGSYYLEVESESQLKLLNTLDKGDQYVGYQVEAGQPKDAEVVDEVLG
jgi:hypothetical protein